ncbi:PAS domain S-box-containing protein [Sphingomonas guangdongensis]|uniref:histidine kinase n=1 Tax=Sphingomonas guangdongensis TaxID=1141890 RepID=A0A285R4N4_9SPHN|nr:PAS domain S-box-containing protein [Sphingomonas guangdongensis]
MSATLLVPDRPSAAGDTDFADVVRLAADTFAAPVAAIGLVAGDQLLLRARAGLVEPALPLVRGGAELSGISEDLLVVGDVLHEPRCADDPLVTATNARFYAAATLRDEDGITLGILAVIDPAPRPDGATPQQRLVLQILARQVTTHLALRRTLDEQERRGAELARLVDLHTEAERALQSIEERYRLAGFATNDAVWDWDLVGNEVTWNDALTRSYGYAPAAVAPTGDWWLQHIHADDRDRIDHSIHALLDGPDTRWSAEYRFRRADNSYASILDRGYVIRDVSGRATRMIGAMLDLTERQESRAALAISEERLRLATDAADVGFWDVDLIADVLIWPPIVKRMFGISADAPISIQDFYDGLHPSDRDATSTALAAACDPAQRALYDVEYRTVGKEDGIVRWVAAKGRGIFDDTGRCTRVVGTAIDITARKQADSALLESEARLRFLRELDEALQGALDPPAAMMAAATLLARWLQSSRCAYADVDADNDRFVIRDDYVAPGVASSAGVYNLDLFGSRAAADMRAGRMLIVRDVGAELDADDGREMFRSIGIDAIICCPLVKDDRLVAMMAVHQDHPRDWQEEEIALVAAVVERCWAHVQRIGAEARLRDSEERYRTLFEAVDSGFTIAEVKFDDGGRAIDYRLLESNPAFERQVGMGGLAGRWVREALPGLEEHWFERYGKVAATGEPLQFENYAAPLGRWFDVHAYRIGSAGANQVAILFNDITARKQAEQTMQALNERLEAQVAERTAELRFSRDIIEATASPICAFDADLRLIAFNRAHNNEFGRVHGFETRIGDRFPDLFPPEQRVRMTALMRRALSGERFTVVEQFGRAEYGQPHWEISYTPLCDASGAIIGAFHMADDVSDRLRAEQELTLAQEALRQSQKMEAMGSLTGGVAHDFNNLLTPIIGSLDMLQRKGLGGEREQRLIGGALQSAERAKTLVQRLLAFARRQPLQTSAVDVTALVHDMGELVASTCGPQTRVTLDVPDDLPAALADHNQVEMAILNLSVNARDAMPDGGRLTIAARGVEVADGHPTGLAPGRYLRLSVTDTGVGMDAETLRRAVEPFYSTKGIGKGTGLGLSMVHGLAAQLGGALAIDSRRGLGTDVQLWLPTTDQPATAAQRGDVAPARPSAGLALVVDDEEVVRASTADMLLELGYAVTEAGSAEHALALLDGGYRPDLLVTDHLMPGRSGSELAREVLARLPGTRTLIVSGYADVEGIAPDLPRLSKPFRQADLAASIAAHKA